MTSRARWCGRGRRHGPSRDLSRRAPPISTPPRLNTTTCARGSTAGPPRVRVPSTEPGRRCSRPSEPPPSRRWCPATSPTRPRPRPTPARQRPTRPITTPWSTSIAADADLDAVTGPKAAVDPGYDPATDDAVKAQRDAAAAAADAAAAAQAARTPDFLKKMIEWDLSLPPEAFTLAITTFDAQAQIARLAALDITKLLDRPRHRGNRLRRVAQGSGRDRHAAAGGSR